MSGSLMSPFQPTVVRGFYREGKASERVRYCGFLGFDVECR